MPFFRRFAPDKLSGLQHGGCADRGAAGILKRHYQYNMTMTQMPARQSAMPADTRSATRSFQLWANSDEIANTTGNAVHVSRHSSVNSNAKTFISASFRPSILVARSHRPGNPIVGARAFGHTTHYPPIRWRFSPQCRAAGEVLRTAAAQRMDSLYRPPMAGVVACLPVCFPRRTGHVRPNSRRNMAYGWK